jgi:hypothetical protein
MPKSNYLDNAMINAALCATAFTPPTTVYVALFTATPTSAGGGTEVSGGAYARQSAAFTTSSGTTDATSNSANVTFPVATANWGTITSFALFDAATGGNMLYFGNLTANVTINTGGQFQFASGGISVSES